MHAVNAERFCSATQSTPVEAIVTNATVGYQSASNVSLSDSQSSYVDPKPSFSIGANVISPLIVKDVCKTGILTVGTGWFNQVAHSITRTIADIFISYVI